MALIDDEGLPSCDRVDLVGAEQIDDLDLALRAHRRGCRPTSRPPLPGTKPRSSPPTRAAAVCSTLKPFQSALDHAAGLGQRAARAASTAAPSARGSAPMPRISIGFFAARSTSANGWRPSAISCSVCGPAPRCSYRIGEIELRPDHGRLCSLPLEPALAEARIDHRRFPARVGADQQAGIGLLDAGDGGVEEIAGAAARIEPRRPAGSRGWASPAPSSAPSAPASPRHRRDRRRWRRCARPATPAQARGDGGERLRARSPAAACRRAGHRAGRAAGGFRPSQAKRVLSEIHSSFTSSLRRGRTRITSLPRASTRMLLPTASSTSTDSVFAQLPRPRA